MIQRETLKLEKSERLATVTMGSHQILLPFKLINGFAGPSKDKRWTIGTEATFIIGLSVRTIEDYFSHVRAKLGCSNKTTLIIKLNAIL